MDRIAALFHAALELSPPIRETFLDEAAANEDAEVVARTRALLAAHDSAEKEVEHLAGLGSEREAGSAAALLRWSALETAGPPELSSGDRIGRYAIIRRLGTGGMGAVYLAHDPVLDRHVALKLLPPLLDDPERLLDEARAASALDHPNIGTIYEVGRDEEGRHYLAMASYEGGTLRDRLAAGPLPIDEAVEVAVRTADALHAAHEQGIVHRDVKPENLIFDPSGRVKIVDFGIADATRRTERSGSTGGTIAYMSPEQAAGGAVDGTVDGRADLWSLGVVLFEMLTGRRPFEGVDREAVLAAIDRASPEPLDTLRADAPSGLAAVVARALARDRDDRFATGKTFAAALREATAEDPSLGHLLRGKLGRRVAAALAVVTTLVFLVGVVVAREAPRLIEARGWAGAAFEEWGRVVVADLEAPDDLAELALAVREGLVVDLQQSGFVAVVGRRQVAATLERMGHPSDTRIEGALALEVAERNGAGALIEVTVARAGSPYHLSARALEPTTGEELFAVRAAAGERRILSGVERLSREIRLRLGESRETLAASRPLPEVTTPSLDALRMFAEAERWHVRDEVRAAAFLRAALELDPEFATAHRTAGAVAVNNLRFSDAAIHLRLAWDHRERLPDRERWYVEAIHASEVAFEPWRAAELYERILSRFPNDARAAGNLGSTRMSWLNDPEGARAAWQQSLAGDEVLMPMLVNAVYSAALFGDLDEADRLAEQAEAAGMEGFMERWRVARAFSLGDRDGTTAACAVLLAAALPPHQSVDDREICGSMDVANGEIERGIARLEAVLPGYLREGRHRNVAHAAHGLAAADLLRGDTAGARSRLLSAMEDLPAEGFAEPDRFITRQNIRIQAAFFGWNDIAELAATRYPPYADPDHWFGRAGEQLVVAAAAVHAGDGEAALRALDGAFPPGVLAIGWRPFDELLRGYAFEALGETEAAAAHFGRASDRRWTLYPVLTKDRVIIPLAVAGLERVTDGQDRAGSPSEAPSAPAPRREP